MFNGNSVLLEGYEFELKGYISAGGKTTLIMNVSGDGSVASELTSWVLELSGRDGEKEELNIVSCEKRKGNGTWIPAAAQNTAFELIGDVGISGIIIEERVGGEKSDPDMEFRIIFDKEYESGYLRAAYLSGDDIYVSEERIELGSADKTWLTPIEKTFCLYVTVTDGYKPEGTCRANVSILKRGAFIINEKGFFDAGNELCPENRQVKTMMLGSVKITACVPLKSYQASGDTVSASAWESFEVCETLGYSNESNFDIKDVIVYPKRESLDLTLLNSYCGKSVYRIDGQYVIDCKHCI